MGSPRRRRRRMILWLRDHTCYYCGRPTVWFMPQNGQRPLPRSATIEHILSRHNPKRTHRNRSKTVLACYECNQSRHREDKVRFRKSQRLLSAAGVHRKPGQPRPFVEDLL